MLKLMLLNLTMFQNSNKSQGITLIITLKGIKKGSRSAMKIEYMIGMTVIVKMAMILLTKKQINN